jgi:molybdenum-dependent DNA-binding transcriptional regulator ModE
MFSFLRPNPLKSYRKQYGELLEAAMQAQRRGDIRGYSSLTEQAEEVAAKIEALEKQAAKSGT